MTLYPVRLLISTVVVILHGLAISQPIYAEQLVFASPESKPIYYRDHDGSITGSLVDNVLKPLQKHSDLSLKLTILPAKRFYADFEKLKFDFIMTGSQQPNAESIILSNIPVSQAAVVLYSRMPLVNFSTLLSLPPGTIGMRRGFALGDIRRRVDMLGDQHPLTLLNNSKNILRLLQQKRIDYAIDYRVLNDNRKTPPFEILEEYFGYLAVHKNNPSGKPLLAKLNRLLVKVMKEESRDNLF